MKHPLTITALTALTLLCSLSLQAQIAAPGDQSNQTPVFDPSNETVSFLGKTFTLKDSRVGTHFESYLAATTYKSKDALLYQKQLNHIKKTLMPGGVSEKKVESCYALLKQAAQYKGDHNVSESLGAAVSAALLINDKIKESKKEILQIKEKEALLKKRMEFIETKSELGVPKKVNQKRPPKPTHKKSAKYIAIVKELAELKVKKKKLELVGVVESKQAQLNFQSLLVQLFIQRRFEHVVIGCRFYKHLFTNADNNLHLKKKSLVHDFFDDSLGVKPTLTGLESFTLEVIQKTQNLTQASQNHLKKGQLDAACNRLLEAYAIGEHLTHVQMLPIQDKQPLLKYTQTSNNLLESIDARDFTTARKLNTELKAMATDYRHTKMDAYISSYTASSDQNVAEAYVYMKDGNRDAMFQSITNAKQLWPNNPKVDTFYKVVNGQLDKKIELQDNYASARKSFDKLYSDQLFLKLLETKNWNHYIGQFSQRGDQERLEKLYALSRKYTPVVKTLESAQFLADAKKFPQAWETTVDLHLEYPELDEIQAVLNEYHAQAPKFVKLLERASRFIDTTDYGSALSCYLKALEISPKSEKAKKGIDHLLTLRGQ